MIHVVLLSGGSGTRLWPLSSANTPKQFLKVLRDSQGMHVSMVQRVFSQIDAVDAPVHITVATSAGQAALMREQLPGGYDLVVEPERRNTAPAIMLACAHLDLVRRAAPDDVVVVMPIDTFADQEYYDLIPQTAQVVRSGTAELVLLGVLPTEPSERYGYILPRTTEGDAWPVASFAEKPTSEVARGYMRRGGLWNCGVFAFRLGWLRRITDRYVVAREFEELRSAYDKLPRNSFDYEVVEGTSSVAVVPYKGTWKDLGTWDALCQELCEATSGPVWLDEGSTSGVHVINKSDIPVAVAGVHDAVVIATLDGILVLGKHASPVVGSLAERIAAGSSQRR